MRTMHFITDWRKTILKTLRRIITILYPLILSWGIVALIWPQGTLFLKEPVFWIVTLAITIPGAFYQERKGIRPTARYQDERFYQKRNQLLIYWTWLAIGIGITWLALQNDQGTTLIATKTLAIAAIIYILGVGVVEGYARFAP